jgi:hypothetical protein
MAYQIHAHSNNAFLLNIMHARNIVDNAVCAQKKEKISPMMESINNTHTTHFTPYAWHIIPQSKIVHEQGQST